MTPNERKAELVRNGRTMADIARELGCSIAHVSHVVAGRRRAPEVERAVAVAIGRPVTMVFEVAA